MPAAVNHLGRVRLVLLVLALAASMSGHAFGQGKPLGKSDLIRQLTLGMLGKAEVTALVRRNCVTFRPTARDQADLRAVGADNAFFAAIDECLRARAAARPGGRGGPLAGAAAAPKRRAGPAGTGGGGARGAPGGARGAALRIVGSPSVAADAGSDAAVTVRLLRGNAPLAGTLLLLTGSGAILGGSTEDARALTNARGVATFRIAAGTTAGTHRLAVALAYGAPPLPGGQIEFVTQPARTLRVTAAPREVTLRPGAAGGAVTVTATDAYGNPLRGLLLELRPVTAELVGAAPLRNTDEQGKATFPLLPAAVRREGEVGVFARGGRVASFSVRFQPLVVSAQRTQFTGGAEQHGVAGAPLAQPLLFEVRDTSGVPIAGQSVAFAVTGGDVAPASAQSDSSGAVEVRVTLGQRAGPVVVTGTVGPVTKTAIVYGDPGPPSELVVLRDSVPASAGGGGGPLAVQSRAPIVLRVVARDQYGNDVALTDLGASAAGQSIRVSAASVVDSRGVVRLEPRRTGSDEVRIRGSGLEARVAVAVTLPSAVEGWVFGGRGSFVGFVYSFKPLSYVQGRAGFRGEVFAGRAVTARLRVELGTGFGSLKADTGRVEVSVALTQEYVRAEYGLSREAAVRPVVSLGGGVFKILSDDPRHIVYHSSLFWLAGVGADFTLGRRVSGELRIETHQLNEMTSSIVNGHVGALTMVTAGVRLRP